MTHRVVVPLALICGLLAAFASSARAASRPFRVIAIPPKAVPIVLSRCPAPDKAPAAKAPSKALFDAFGILRRERTDQDTLSRAALRMLRLRGIRVADPQSARLLRSSARGGRAWVVPVADVTPLLGIARMICTPTVPRAVRPRGAVRRRAAARRRPARGVLRIATPVPFPVDVRPATPVPFGPAPFPAYAPIPYDGKPQEGLVVVAEGDAPAGGGGVHKRLIRGLAAPAVAPCAGPKRDLVSVSGIVPDGVGSVFLTSADGTAVKTGVQDNGYAFLVPPGKGREAWAPRYVVWTGGDGTPHVQQVALSRLPSRLCKAVTRRRNAVVEVTPSGGVEAGPFPLFATPRAFRVPRPRRP